MRSKNWGLAAAILALVTATAAAGPSQSADERELARLETVWNEAHERGDADALDRLWSDDFEVAVPRMPLMSKRESLGFARSGRMKFERYSTSDIVIRVYGKSAVVTGKMERVRTFNGQRRTDRWQFTKVYVKQSGQWRVVNFQASEAAP